MVHAAVAHASPGDVLVLTSAEPAPVALVGELLATQAQVRGVAGMLVDGAVRDLDELAAIGLPIWARFVRAQGATKGEVGELDVPVVVGGDRDPARRSRRDGLRRAVAVPHARVGEVLPRRRSSARSASGCCASATRPASSPTTCRGFARSWRADGGRRARPRRGRRPDRRRPRRRGLRRAGLGSRAAARRGYRTPRARGRRRGSRRRAQRQRGGGRSRDGSRASPARSATKRSMPT